MPYTVVLAEKPSVAKDIANFLAQKQGGKPVFDKGGGYRLPNNDLVTYTVGHLIEMEMPDAYLPSEQQNADPLTYLPLFPEQFKYRPRSKRDEKTGAIVMRDGKPVPDPLFKFVEKELKKADVIINAGDIGREGQLIMDELFAYVGLSPSAKHIKRVSIVDMNPKGIEEGFSKIGPNAEAVWNLSGVAGRCRAEADWEVGINASRAYWSVTGSKRVALGRIKTVVLAMVSDRCQAIERFKSVKYFVPIVTLSDGVEMVWKGRPGCEGMPGFDEHGRIISKELADSIVAQINAGLAGKISNVRNKINKTAPPKPFSLATLQAEASRRLGLTVEEVTKAAQSLYERHKIISYVGTECQYYPETMLTEARDTMAMLSPMFNKLMSGANASMTPPTFNDAKLDEHHAIAPLGLPRQGDLNEKENGVYEMVVRRFAAQFYPHYEYRSLGIEADFGKDHFEAKATETVKMGWKEAEGFSAEDVEEEITQSAGQIEVEAEENASREDVA